ncbi:MAG: hypothetical protein MR815_02620, partial [Oscillospiraceae bacterium]|nr:hypothetical protein [Oscillospiraceae bacterium]
AELFLTCLDLSAAEVPCKTAPFASFSGRTEKGGPARPERIPIYEIVLVHFDEMISLFRQAERPGYQITAGPLLKLADILGQGSIYTLQNCKNAA